MDLLENDNVDDKLLADIFTQIETQQQTVISTIQIPQYRWHPKPVSKIQLPIPAIIKMFFPYSDVTINCDFYK